MSMYKGTIKNRTSAQNETFNFKILNLQIRKIYTQMTTFVPNENKVEDIIEIFEYFINTRKSKMPTEHKRLTNLAIEKIIANLNASTYLEQELYYMGDLEFYEPIIDFYFTQEFEGNNNGACDYSINHFMNEEVRSICYFNVYM